MQELKNKHKKFGLGFTLVELLVVITILGILATIGLVAFTSAQARGRDTQRKSDLKQIASALELFYSDYGKYPDSGGGQIKACGYNSATSVGTLCVWGSGEFRDTNGSGNTKTTYFKSLPKDPIGTYNYYYRPVTVSSVANQGFQLYAELENSQDQNCLGGNCSTHNDLPSGVSCGSNGSCNFAVMSANVTATQQ